MQGFDSQGEGGLGIIELNSNLNSLFDELDDF